MPGYRNKQAAAADGYIERLEQGPGGKNLCRYCKTEVSPPRRTFCSEACVHEYKILNHWNYARSQVIKRDKGICQICFIDCRKQRREILALPAAQREECCKEIGVPIGRIYGRLHDIDHSTPIVEWNTGNIIGNIPDHLQHLGAQQLGNLRLLCLSCHKKVTGELRKRLKKQH